ncbi:mitochondrial fission ELM1 family protein [Gluconobacter sphaericus]|uniref:mitochondrial fission ELM1 family protein n=1 Tax=Gluconobacter sphaericus TaxID=574987 RepID=UPI001B8CCF09|nr:mitochondrial fission ELM1 family protein [Gluconobacter sphaericus]MBS1086108.1 mitochondrial fission ELM1 family protein [Gluconobacter sphaericus]MBS1099899.1 mitochondrial fission ELM1 family protein [Gluconobacter sphaericus]
MKAIIIAEDFAGMRAQGAGLAEKAGLEWDFQPVCIQPFWSRFPARYWPSPLRRVNPIRIPEDTDLIICIGGTGGVIGRAVARREGLPVVQIQNPRMPVSRFELVIANTHDDISGPNVLISRNALHPVTPKKLAVARTEWEERLKQGARPLLSILVGGANGRFSLGAVEAERMAEGIITFTKRNDIQAVLTPSRRTDPAAVAIFRKRLEPHGIAVLTGSGGDNPYMGILACADMIAVTTDSVSMISEAVATSAPVLVFPLPGRSSRISRFVKTLEDAGRVKWFDPAQAPWNVMPLDDTPLVAREMRRRLKL